MYRKITLIATAFALAIVPAFAQETITFQDGVSPTADYEGTQDTHIISWDDGDYGGTAQGQLYRHNDPDPAWADWLGQNAGNTPDPNDHEENPQNMGGLDLMEEGDNGGGSDDSKALVIQFDLGDTIPASRSSEVSSAQIGLYFDQLRDGNDNPAHDVYVNRILKEWAEGEGADPELYPDDNNYDGTDTFDNTGAVTWNSTGFELWQAMGAEGPEDVAPTESTTHLDPGDVGLVIWFDVTESAKIWIADPSQNHGVKISQEVYPDAFLEPDLDILDGKGVYYYSSHPVESPSVYENARFVFRTSEHAEADTHPQLVITFGGSTSVGAWELY